jgi:hypothetical protein
MSAALAARLQNLHYFSQSYNFYICILAGYKHFSQQTCFHVAMERQLEVGVTR